MAPKTATLADIMVLSMTKLKAFISAIAINSFINAMIRSNVNINVGTIEFKPVVDLLGQIRKVGRIGLQNKNNLSNKQQRMMLWIRCDMYVREDHSRSALFFAYRFWSLLIGTSSASSTDDKNAVEAQVDNGNGKMSIKI